MYGSAVPGLEREPKAWVSVKLPMGVADWLSLGVVVKPSEPTWAGTEPPCGNHPPPGAFVQLCRLAVVLPVEPATTVTTWLAEPVLNGSGRLCPRAGAGAGAEPGEGPGPAVVACAGPVEAWPAGVVGAAGRAVLWLGAGRAVTDVVGSPMAAPLWVGLATGYVRDVAVGAADVETASG